MFGLFRKKEPECPLTEETRLWLEYAFIWLVKQLGEERVKSKEVILPSTEFFPFKYDGSAESLYKTAKVIARQMDVNLEDINLQLYKDSLHSIGSQVYTQTSKTEGESLSAGLYFARDEDGKYDIFIEKANIYQPEKLVAILAHGFARVILLRGARTGVNLEFLSDITSAVLGLGIFNANCSFKFYKAYDGWGYSSLGYLKQPQWGYLLALYAYYLNKINPEWINSLSPNVLADFKRSRDYILANTEKIFKQEYKPVFNSKYDEIYSGEWQGQYTYGKGYGKRAGKSVAFVINMEVTGGLVQGVSVDDEFKKISNESAYIEGEIKDDIISYKLTYPFYWKTEDGQAIPVHTQPSHKVLYHGKFLNGQFSGSWLIKSIRRDRDGVYYDHVSSGTWSMQKLP